jgi:hypothetical protein
VKGPRGDQPFSRLDANHDGKLQPAELERAAKMLDQALRESKGKDLTAEDWNRLASKLRRQQGQGQGAKGDRPGLRRGAGQGPREGRGGRRRPAPTRGGGDKPSAPDKPAEGN